MSALTGLQCHLCKATFPAEAIYVCDQCLGPLEPAGQTYPDGRFEETLDQVFRYELTGPSTSPVPPLPTTSCARPSRSVTTIRLLPVSVMNSRRPAASAVTLPG